MRALFIGLLAGLLSIALAGCSSSGLSTTDRQTVAPPSSDGHTPEASFTVRAKWGDSVDGRIRFWLFDGGRSTDPDGGSIVNYAWDFGDGSSLSGPFVLATHIYAPGTYTATLTVTDDEGETATDSQEIRIRDHSR